MSREVFNPYSEQIATVVGGRGALGSRLVPIFEKLGFHVQICEQGDPFTDFAKRSRVIFFAVNNTEIKAMLQASRDSLRPDDHSILDGASVKKPLIPIYKELDKQGLSIASTHLGAVPAQPWRGIKVWVCEVGPNSERAKRLAIDLFSSTNSSIQLINIKDHKHVEEDQWMTMAIAHIFAAALRAADSSLGKFDLYATLNAELQALPVGRTLGQGTKVPGEVLFNQPMKMEFLAALKEGISQLEQVLGDRDKLQEFMQGNIDFHNPDGTVKALFEKAGVIGARNANLRMHSLSFCITNDQPGVLREMLEPFYKEGANITAIDSMPGTISDEEQKTGVNPDKIVDFHIGIDPATINPEKEARIKEELIRLGCSVS